MSIPCNNRITCRCENSATLETIKQWMEDNHRDFIDFDTNENDRLDFDIDHDYGFPATMLKQMTGQIPSVDTLRISVVTFDQGHEYIAHHEFHDNKWRCLYENYACLLCERL